MAVTYNSVSVSGYNASPPEDDGTQASSNEVSWSKHKTKLGDPLKTAIETIDSRVDTAFDDCFSITGNQTISGANTFSGDNSMAGVRLPEGTAPSTASSEGALYTKDTSGQPELFYREESDGDEVQITSGGSLNVTAQTLPKNYLTGLTLSNNATDGDHDIDIAAGEARGSDDDEDIVLSAITKRIDATWASGTGNGGLSSSLTAPANDTWYHVHAIVVGGSADVGFDTSITAANLVADHSATAYRPIGVFQTDGSANIKAFEQIGNTVLWSSPVADISGTASTGSRTSHTMSTPPGIKATGIFHATFLGSNNSVDMYFYISSLDTTDVAASASHASLAHNDHATQGYVAGQFFIPTDTSSQIGSRGSAARAMNISTEGWVYDWSRHG